MTALDLKLNARLSKSLAPAGIAVAVCLGYYFGALVGLELRLPPATPSVVWPPNATLTAALLLTRRDRWWIVLAAALPAHLAVQLQTDWPRTLIAALFFTNCFEALIAAVRSHFAAIFASRPVGITLQIDEGQPVFDAKHSNLHPLFEGR